MSFQQGTGQHNRIIKFWNYRMTTASTAGPGNYYIWIWDTMWGRKASQHTKRRATCIPTPEHQYKARPWVTTATPACSLPHNYWFYCHRIKGRRQDSFLGGSQSQMLHIWQSIANKNLIPSPSLWNQKVFFQICFLRLAPVWRENQENAHSAAKERLNPVW